MTPLKATKRQVLAFRLAAQGVTKPGRSAVKAFADGWAIQDSPPGAATTAALARTANLEAGWLDDALTSDKSVIALYNARTATAFLPSGDAAAYGTALLPEGDAALKAVLGRAVPEQKSGLQERVDVAVDAISDALDGKALSKDDLHQALRERLPDALLPWCEGCQSHHARRGLLVMASLRGRLCISGRDGRQPVFSRTDQWAEWSPPAPATARRSLVRRYVGWYGPTTPAQLADWAGLAKSHANELWATIEDDLQEVSVDGQTKAWILAADEQAFTDSPTPEGVHLIGPGDPLLQAKDREVIVPNEAARKKAWTSIPTTGIVLLDGEAVALWKAKKAGKRLDLAVTPIEAKAPLEKAEDDLLAQAERLAPHRGCERAAVKID